LVIEMNSQGVDSNTINDSCPESTIFGMTFSTLTRSIGIYRYIRAGNGRTTMTAITVSGIGMTLVRLMAILAPGAVFRIVGGKTPFISDTFTGNLTDPPMTIDTALSLLQLADARTYHRFFPAAKK
jgi:hypothetical protein